MNVTLTVNNNRVSVMPYQGFRWQGITKGLLKGKLYRLMDTRDFLWYPLEEGPFGTFNLL